MRLLADIGGTNARFALWSKPNGLTDLRVLAVADYPRFEDALAHYPEDVTVNPQAILVAAAGPKVAAAFK